MRRLAIAPLLLAVPAAVAVSGCAGGGSTDNAKDYEGAQKSVAEAVDDIVRHARRQEARDICDGFLSAAVKTKLTALAKSSGRGTDCADQLEKSLRDVDAFDVDIRSIRVTGSDATVSFRVKTSADKDPTGTWQMVDERGWRLSKLP